LKTGRRLSKGRSQAEKGIFSVLGELLQQKGRKIGHSWQTTNRALSCAAEAFIKVAIQTATHNHN